MSIVKISASKNDNAKFFKKEVEELRKNGEVKESEVVALINWFELIDKNIFDIDPDETMEYFREYWEEEYIARHEDEGDEYEEDGFDDEDIDSVKSMLEAAGEWEEYVSNRYECRIIYVTDKDYKLAKSS